MSAPAPRSLRHRALLLALTSPVLAMALWLLIRSGERSTPAPPPAVTRAIDDEARALAVAPVAAIDDASARPTSQTERRPEELVAPSAIASAVPRAFFIEVVDEAGLPVAGAPVVVMCHPTWAPENPFERKLLVTGTTGAEGRAAFDPTEVARGRHADSILEATIGPGLPDAPRTVLSDELAAGDVVRLVVSRSRLEGRPGTRVRVVDATGRPVGGIECRWNAHGEQREGNRLSIVGSHAATARTDTSTGIAELSRLALHALRRRPSLPTRSYGYRVSASALLAEPVVLELGATLPLEEVPTLALPPTGALLVRVEQHDGTALVRGGIVHVSTADASGAIVEQALDAGRALFSAVGLGLELELSAWSEDGRSGRLVVAGPHHQGETASAVVLLGRDGQLVRFTALDEAGAPLADVALEVDPLFTQPAWAPPALRTDAEGRASLRFPRGFVSGVSAVHLTAEAARNAALFADLSGELVLPADAREEAVELGAIAFEGPPPSLRALLVSGRVLDERGAPVEGALVAVVPQTDRREWRVSVRSTSDGAFELLGPIAAPMLVVSATAEGYRPASLEALLPGTGDIVLRLAVGARLEAHVLLPRGVPHDLLQIDLVGPSSHSDLHGPHVVVDSLAPGVYQLQVRTAQGRWLVTRVPELTIDVGAPSDPRLDPLDLTDVLRVCRLRLESAMWGPLFHEVPLVEVERWGDGPARTDEEGRLVLIVPADATWVEVRPPGHRPQRCAPSAVERVLTFEPE